MTIAEPAFLTVFLIALLVVFTRGAVVIGTATLFLRTRLLQARRVYRRDFGKGQLWNEARSAVVVLVADAAVFALVRSQGWLHFAEPTPARTAFTLVLFFVWYEFWFYVTHRAMHTRALYRIHAQHHVARVTHPLTSLSFGLIERGGLLAGSLGFAVVVSHFVPITLFGLAGYVLLNYVLNVWGHLNVELLPASYGRSGISRLFISTTFHALHHARYTGHYGLFTPVLDRMFGTAWEDYPEVHARAALGNGLTTMGERVVTAPATDPVGSSLQGS